MHDFLEVLGLSGSAPPLEVRRLSARYVRRWHPDFASTPSADASMANLTPRRDAAVDYVDPLTLLDRIQASFFATSD